MVLGVVSGRLLPPNICVCVIFLELLTGWWRVSDIEELRALVNALHSRGIREKGLQRQIQKYLEIIPQVCTKHKDGKCLRLTSGRDYRNVVIAIISL